LRTYAAILGAGFQAVETPGALRQALEEYRNKGLILIDTAGYGAGDDAEADELSRVLTAAPDIQVHLALSASMKSADLRRVADRFARFHPARLLFTRLDETSTFGALWAESIRQSRPLSFFSNGPRIPEDLQEATPELVAGLVLGAFSNAEASEEWRPGDASPGGDNGPVDTGSAIRPAGSAVAA
jgi:flagellar biosynthesis protein FlhF